MIKFKIKDLIIPTIIFVSDETILFGTNSNQLFIYLKYLILMGVAVYLACLKKSLANPKVTRICICMCGIIVLSSLLNFDLRLGLIYKIVILTVSCLITQLYSLKEFANRYVRFIYFLACFSLVGYAIALFMPPLMSKLPRVVNISGGEYYNMLFYTQQVNKVSDLMRNEGCFREAGVYQMFLNLALVFQIYFADNFKVKYFVVLLLALVLTFSTTGYATVFLVLLLFIFSNKSTAISKKTKFGLIGLIIAGIGFLFAKSDLFSAEGILLSKFQQEGNESSIARISSVTTNIEIWKSSPLFGIGLNINDLFSRITLNTYGIETEHNTNTLLYELACWGIFYFLILIGGIIKFCSRIGNKMIEHIIMFLILFFLSIGENLVFSTFFFVLMFYGYNMLSCKSSFHTYKRLK